MRNISTDLQNAILHENSYKPLSTVEIFPSAITFSALTRDNTITGADTNPADDDPMRQDIIYNAIAGLVTFYADGSLKYAIDGDSTPVTTTTSSTIKPGAYGSKIYVQVGTDVIRYSINWSSIVAKSTTPISSDATLTPTDTPVAVHGISETECVVIGDGDGGLSIAYFNGTTETLCPSRFMFPSQVEWDDAATRDIYSLGIFSTAMKLGNRIFVYVSNAPVGSVQGIFYDTTTGTWSDTFIAMPTDLDISMCEFRISNGFERNNKAYIAGQFIRTDLYNTNLPYTLILASEDGIHFSIDRFTYVTGLGYRFLATVGSDNNLYLGNCNRVCEAPSTWVFDGDDDSTSPISTYPMEEIISVNFSEDSATITLAAGTEAVYDDPNLVVGARVKLWDGLNTVSGDEYILYETYIVETIRKSYADGKRSYVIGASHEAQWKLGGLTMPFYAEWQGLSSMFDPMTEASGKLYAAPGMGMSETKFWVDFWSHKGYKNSSLSITKTSLTIEGGVGPKSITGSHKKGIIMTQTVATHLGVSQNPKITATSLPVKIYGWSRAETTGNENDTVNIIIQTCNKNGRGVKTVVTSNSYNWPQQWPDKITGDKPISFSVTGDGIEEGRYIKKVGLVFEAPNSTTFCPARVEFTSNVEVEVALKFGNSPWEDQGDGTFTVPAEGEPFIMFAQRPYNAFNFDIAASFENTVTGGVVGYPAATGLVGHAEDGLNFTLARYDVVSNKVQLVVLRNGIETEIANATPGWSLGTLNEMVFQHKDGTYKVFMLNEGTGVYEEVLSYDWVASDGYMTTSKVITMKTGIWGGIMSPSIKTLGYAGKSQDDVSNTAGIPIDPMGGLGPFPSSGELSIDGNIYSYSSRKWNPSYVPGPYQVRNNAIWPPPLGNGKAGLECSYFNWNGNPNKYKGKLIALDTGSNFISAGSLWRVYITTGGSPVYLRNRSRHYSNNKQISKISVSLANRCFPGVGGFFGVQLTEGKSMRHTMRARAFLHLDGDITCYWFMGTGGEQDVTIRDLVKTATGLCGVRATFPGDYYDASLTVNGETAIFQDDYSEGFDLEYDLASPTTHEIRTNIKLNSENYDNGDDFDTDTGLKLVLTNLGSGNYRAALVSTPSGTIIHQRDYTSGTSLQHFRVLFHTEGISLYHNYRWVMSVACDELIYTQASYVDIKAYTASSIDFSEVYVHDLSDIREAIYIDLDTNGGSAMKSIIQERPVEIGPNPDGSIHLMYDEINRNSLTLLTEPQQHDHDETFPMDSMSDAIIYGAGEVVTLVKTLFADKFGLSTKIIRVPSLNIGAPEAAYRLMKIAYESKDRHSIKARPDPRIQVGDILTIGYTLSGSGKVFPSTQILVESVSRTISQRGKNFSASMTITARGYLNE